MISNSLIITFKNESLKNLSGSHFNSESMDVSTNEYIKPKARINELSNQVFCLYFYL